MAAHVTSKPKAYVEGDGLSAYVHLDPKEDHSEITTEVILDALRDAKVVVTDEVKARVESVCRQARVAKRSDPDYLVAEATLPTPPVDAELVLCDSLSHASTTPPEGTDERVGPRVDYYAQSRLATVSRGDEIGVISPSIPGVAGLDVLGKVLPVSGQPRDLSLGEGVRLGDDGKSLFANIAGLVVTRDHKVDVIDVIRIDGDVDFNTGSLNVDSDVVITGTVHDLFTVKSTKSVSVGGAIEAAHVVAGKDIVVRGGVAGRDKGSVRAGGTVVCRFCDGMNVRTGGDLTITKVAVNSHLRTEAKLAIPRGALIGGQAHARGGAVIKELGSEGEVPTTVTIGLDPVILAQAAQMDAEVGKRRAAAEKTRTTIKPLLAELNRLAPDQRRRATELTLEADGLDASAERLLADKDRMIREGSCFQEPALVVTDRIHPGVRLVFEDYEYVVREVVRGPVRMFTRRTDAGPAAGVTCVNTISGARRELFCRKYVPEIPPANDLPAGAETHVAPNT